MFGEAINAAAIDFLDGWTITVNLFFFVFFCISGVRNVYTLIINMNTMLIYTFIPLFSQIGMIIITLELLGGTRFPRKLLR